MKQTKDLQVSIIGGGLVGSLCACLLGNKGVRVKLHEYRDDPRGQECVSGRSINLALSARGRSALSLAGLEDEVLANHAIPMRGRMLHDTQGRTTVVPYHKDGKCIYSVGRRSINEMLLTAAEKNSNVEITFKSKFLNCDIKSGKYKVRSAEGEIKEDQSDLLIGCDGAYSAVRRQMLKMTRFNYSQNYIDTGYLELCIPATDKGEYGMPANYLHIWPRHSFMLIALPNQDRSFTVTLMMPFSMFDAIRTPENLTDFFDDTFGDAAPLIGREKLIADFFKLPPSPLVSIKCNPHHIGVKMLLMGDAAHAIVPFYGQGMNAGFEDCEVLSDLLDSYSYDLKKVLPAYTERRQKDTEFMTDLSLYNYLEMRHLVTSKKFLLRKKLDNFLNTLFPEMWVPLYSMVTFSKLRYSHCVLRKKMQDNILMTVMWSAAVIGLSICIALFTRIIV